MSLHYLRHGNKYSAFGVFNEKHRGLLCEPCSRDDFQKWHNRHGDKSRLIEACPFVSDEDAVCYLFMDVGFLNTLKTAKRLGIDPKLTMRILSKQNTETKIT